MEEDTYRGEKGIPVTHIVSRISPGVYPLERLAGNDSKHDQNEIKFTWPGACSSCLSLLVVVFVSVDFPRTGLNYSEFTVVTDHGSFRTTEGVKAIVEDLSSR